MKKALVVGGTGMLADVSIWLATQGYNVHVVGRNQDRMDRIKSSFPDESLLTPMLLDYRNGDELIEAFQKHGTFNLIVAWIHSIADHSVQTIIKENGRRKEPWSFFHELGSSRDLEETKKRAETPNGCVYHQIQLGFVPEGSTSRWLTNDEIARGVIEAIKLKDSIYTVGMVKPWERRPNW
ncbi:short-chain dehydrogenase [Peribacillus alkalitolerans]|uniref:short-chain dehydrogenase n=1 Tax=Peribacillus alkalitolerans TaxID=1550385 RepID=UPI0013D55821|nr:short-chain dehydrogenase [Peribacillus alkalitolerans]